MARFDRLRVSLLTAITACGPAKLDDDPESESESSTPADTGETPSETATDEDGPGETETETETETGDDTDGCTNLCTDPEVVADGLWRCEDGAINRVAPGGYDASLIELATECVGDEDTLLCTTDADCNAGPFGACRSGTEDEGSRTYAVCRCVYACASDDDCSPGEACIPPGLIDGTPPWPSCQPADCKTATDCGPCGECGLGGVFDGCSANIRQTCRTPDDQCRTPEDCGDFAGCRPSPDFWYCEEIGCTPGRPLLVDDRARTASACRRDDWRATIELAPDPELACHWARIAALEHASVASFARFAMQLMALGAPPELLRATQSAARDEIRHAQLAYGLASAYGGAPVGPGRLELRGVELRGSWREIVTALIEEACVGETLGVAEAMAALDEVEQPAVRRVLEIIVDDERRHAQLAWRCLRWLLDTATAEDRRWALALLNRTIGAWRARGDGHDRPAHGVVAGARRIDVHRQAIAEVLEPVARALTA